jgi:type IV pilus biogenesis protein CpaD/CtpE
MSNQKLSSLCKSVSNRPFQPGGFVDAKGQFVALVKPRGARHSISLATVAMIEDELLGLGVDTSKVAIVAAAYEAVAMEAQIRAEHVKAKAEPKAEPKAKGGLASFVKA